VGRGAEAAEAVPVVVVADQSLKRPGPLCLRLMEGQVRWGVQRLVGAQLGVQGEQHLALVGAQLVAHGQLGEGPTRPQRLAGHLVAIRQVVVVVAVVAVAVAAVAAVQGAGLGEADVQGEAGEVADHLLPAAAPAVPVSGVQVWEVERAREVRVSVPASARTCAGRSPGPPSRQRLSGRHTTTRRSCRPRCE
jgi:hypothetical protein